MNDDRPEVRSDSVADNARDVVPIAGGGHAGAAELQHDPGLTIVGHGSDQ